MDTLLGEMDSIATKLKQNTGLELVVRKTEAILCKERQPDDDVFDRLHKLNIHYSTDGGNFLGVPFGKQDYVRTEVGKILRGYRKDVGALKYFNKQSQWILTRSCVNARPQYLMRVLHPTVCAAEFTDFDNHVTTHITRILGLQSRPPSEEGQMEPGPRWSRIHNFRGLPQELSGGSVKHIGRMSERVNKCRKARANILQFIQRSLPHHVKRLHSLWNQPMEILRIRPKPGYEPPEDPDRLTEALKGHTLGNIPKKYIELEQIPGCPQNPSNEDLAKIKQAADANRLEADLILHSEIMSRMRASPHKQTNIMAAQCLSQSCPNSGPILQAWRKNHRDRMKDEEFVPYLRMRFGIPPITPAPPVRCDCRSRDGGVSLADEPLHPLVCCKRPKNGRLIRRHNAIMYSLQKTLSAIPNVRVTKLEPHMGSDNGKRADITVLYGGSTYLLDVGVCSPGTASKVELNKTAEKPGAAGHMLYMEKQRKYRDDVQPGYIHIPFIVETGGRVHDKARQWLDTIASDSEIMDAEQRIHRVYREIGNTLVHQQAKMLKEYTYELSRDTSCFHTQ